MDKPLFNADAAEEYFTSLCTYYRDTRNDILKRDNEGRHASEQIYSAEYQKFLGMELAMREVLEYFSKFDFGPADGEPLTLEQLKELNGEPVWREQPGYDGRWVLVDCFWSREGVIYLRNISGSSELAKLAFDEGVKVYRRRPEGAHK